MSKKYDFVIVGAGFAGASCARLLTDKNYKCLVVESRPFVSGNCVTDRQNNIDIHFLGGKTLHTDNQYVWDFLSLFGKLHEVRHIRTVWTGSEVYRLPFGLDLLSKIYNKTWVYECEESLKNDIYDSQDNTNIEAYALSHFGKTVYEKTIKNMYEKKYGMPCKEIPVECLEESYVWPLQYVNSFWPDKFQGVPENGYTNLVESILGNDIDVLLNKDFLESKDKFFELCDYVIYTGELDRFFDYCMGSMDWKTTHFEFVDESEKTSNLTGTPITNFCFDNTQWYRMTEHKWLTPWRTGENDFDSHTYVTYEFPADWEPGDDAYFLVPNERSVNLNKRYMQKLKEKYPNVILCGGKPKYKMMSICETIEDAMNVCDKFDTKE